jgi:hypothetical protein
MTATLKAAAAAAILALGIWAWQAYGLHLLGRDRATQEAMASALYAAHHQTFLEDQAHFAQYDFLVARPCTRSIGKFLHPRIPWEPDRPVAEWRSSRGVEALPDLGSFASQLQTTADGETWADRLDQLSLPAVDTGWMDQVVEDYDCWDIYADSPLPALVPYQMVSSPIPKATVLIAWGRLRLLEGLKSGEGRQALETVHGLAEILLQSDQTVLSMVGVALLQDEGRAARSLGESDGRPTFSEDEITRLQRTILGASAHYGPWVPSELLADTERAPVGRCSALTDAVALTQVVHSTMRVERSSQLAQIDRWLDEAPCPNSVVRRMWTQHPSTYDAGNFPLAVCGLKPANPQCRLATLFGRARSDAVREVALEGVSMVPQGMLRRYTRR